MNSKYRLFSTLCIRPAANLTNKDICGSTNRFFQSKLSGFLISRPASQTSKISPRSFLLTKLNWSSQCGCYSRGSNLHGTSVLSSTITTRAYVSTPTTPSSPDNEQPEKKLSLYQRFKAMYRDYWYVLVPVHLVTSATWFGGFYYLASSGVDVVALLENLNVSEKLINTLRNGHATTGYLAISYALYKIATPLRYTVTLGGTTISINYLKRWGYIKPMPSKEKLKEIYKDKKEILKGKGLTLKDNMMQTLKPTENFSSKLLFNECLLKNFLDPAKAVGSSLLNTQNSIRLYSVSNNIDSEKQDSLMQQLKDMFQKYWYILIPVHLVTSFLWLCGFYYVASSGIDIAALLERLHFSEDWIAPFRRGRHKTTGNLAVAYALYHLIAPLRYAATLGCTSVIKKFLRKRGFIPPKEARPKKGK